MPIILMNNGGTMVEAVTSVTNATKTYMQRIKQQDIAWERLSASQILQYLSEGQDVPPEILRWADEVSKILDAPDDITYDSVNGSSNADDIRNSVAQSDEPDADDAAAKQTLTQAQAFRQSMELSGESKYNQGKALAGKSVGAVLSEKTMETSLDKSTEDAEQLGAVAELKANTTEQRTSSMKRELDELLEKAQSKDKNLSPADLNRIATLGSMLNLIGMQAQAEISQIGMQLSALEAEIEQFGAIPATATDFGTETVAIGAELMTEDKEQQAKITDAAKNADGINTAKVALNAAKFNIFSMLFDRNYAMGTIDVISGGNAIDAGVSGNAALGAAQSAMSTQFTKITGAQARIEQNTGVEGSAASGTEKPEDDEQTKPEEEKQAEEKEDKSGEVKVAASKTEEKDVKDSTLVIDIDEKKRRRQALGLE